MKAIFTAKQSYVKGGRAIYATSIAKQKLLQLGFEEIELQNSDSPDGAFIGHVTVFQKGDHRVTVSISYGPVRTSNHMSIEEVVL